MPISTYTDINFDDNRTIYKIIKAKFTAAKYAEIDNGEKMAFRFAPFSWKRKFCKIDETSNIGRC